MARYLNFSAGPAMLPLELLKTVQEEFIDWNHSGMSITELNHRSDAFVQIINEAKNDLRQLMSIPDDYDILFITSPTRSQFSRAER